MSNAPGTASAFGVKRRNARLVFSKFGPAKSVCPTPRSRNFAAGGVTEPAPKRGAVVSVSGASRDLQPAMSRTSRLVKLFNMAWRVLFRISTHDAARMCVNLDVAGNCANLVKSVPSALVSDRSSTWRQAL